jgi:hypothetical protein
MNTNNFFSKKFINYLMIFSGELISTAKCEEEDLIFKKQTLPLKKINTARNFSQSKPK